MTPCNSLTRVEALHACVAGDLERGGGAGGDYPARGRRLQALHLLNLSTRAVPDGPRPRELPLGHLQLPPRQLHHALRVRSLRRRHPGLLRRMPPQPLHVRCRRRFLALIFNWWWFRCRRSDVDGKAQVEVRVLGGDRRRRRPRRRGRCGEEEELELPLAAALVVLRGRGEERAEHDEGAGGFSLGGRNLGMVPPSWCCGAVYMELCTVT
jgi:hypothetical protein